MIKLEKGQIWRSKTHPHESFEIYDGTFDSFVLSDMDIYVVYDFNTLPETAKIYFWRRIDDNAFHEFIVTKKGESYESTYPYTWAGESKRSTLINKIKKYEMELSE